MHVLPTTGFDLFRTLEDFKFFKRPLNDLLVYIFIIERNRETRFLQFEFIPHMKLKPSPRKAFIKLG